MVRKWIQKHRQALRDNPKYILRRPVGRSGVSDAAWNRMRQQEWYYFDFILGDRFPCSKEQLFSDAKPAKPSLSYFHEKYMLKILCHHDLNAVSYMTGTIINLVVSVLILITLLCVYLFSTAPMFKALSVYCFAFCALVLPIHLFCAFILAIIKGSDVPYAIFDGQTNQLVLRGESGDTLVSFDRIHFQLIAINDSTTHGVIEMNIDSPHPSFPPKKIITDIFETPHQAHSILKTYYALLSGDPSIFDVTLQPHPVMWHEFHMPFWKTMSAFRESTIRWFFCVMPHYFCFRYLHGDPLTVLKKFVFDPN